MTNGDYWQRVQERQFFQKIARYAAFGIGLGAIFLVLSGWQYLFVIGINKTLWLTVMCAGFIFMVCGTICPQILLYPTAAWLFLANCLGKWILYVILVAIYCLVITPGGWFFKRSTAGKILSTWENAADAPPGAGWTVKRNDFDVTTWDKQQNLVYRIFQILYFFISNKQWFMIPAAILLMAFGLLFFFVSNSVLSPLLYTLF